MTRVLETPAGVRRDATPLDGPFPVVLTMGVDPALEQSARYEYLASHGYVVAALTWVGSAPWAFGIGEWQPNGIDAMATDLGFLYAWLRNFPSADRSRLAWAGPLTPAGAIFHSRTRLLDAFALTGRKTETPTGEVTTDFATRVLVGRREPRKVVRPPCKPDIPDRNDAFFSIRDE